MTYVSWSGGVHWLVMWFKRLTVAQSSADVTVRLCTVPVVNQAIWSCRIILHYINIFITADNIVRVAPLKDHSILSSQIE